MSKKIVTIGGGSGQFVLLSGLRDSDLMDITAVVSMVDSGGSTGRLRDELGVLPPGDIMKCILALSPHQDIARDLLLYRFQSTNNRLHGHSVGNMLLTMLSQYSGNFPDGVNALSEILQVRGRVFPVTTDKATLVAELTDGSRLYGESAIDVPRGDKRKKIKRAYLVPHHSDSIKVHPPVIKAIREANYIIFGPGDVFTSIVPNLLVPGVKEAINDSKAKLIYIVNIMTKFGETDNYDVKDFVSKIEEYIDRKIHVIVSNNRRPAQRLITEYNKEKAAFVEPPVGMKKYKVVKSDLLEQKGKIVRHNPKKLAKVLHRIIK